MSVRIVEETHKVEVDTKIDKAESVVGPRAMPLAIDSFPICH